MKKNLISLFFVFFLAASAFAIPKVNVINETQDSRTFKISFYEEYNQAIFELIMPQGLFERGNCFNEMNARIRQFQTENKFNSYYRICDDVLRYDNLNQNIVYTTKVQFRTSTRK